jgi:hypothetical protein
LRCPKPTPGRQQLVPTAAIEQVVDPDLRHLDVVAATGEGVADKEWRSGRNSEPVDTVRGHIGMGSKINISSRRTDIE